MFLSHQRNAGQNYNVVKLKYLEKTVTNQITFMKKLRVDLIRGTLVTIQFRGFVFPSHL
jgi:hypothetical protein